MRAYHLGGFSCCRAWSLGQAGFSSCGKRTQQLWHMDFAPPRHMESSQTRDRTCFSCIGRWILNHWTTREVLFFHSYPNFPKIHAFYYVIILMKRFFNVSAEKESCFLFPSVCTFSNSILFQRLKCSFFSVPGLGGSPGVGNGNPLQYYCLENQSHGQRTLVGYSPWGRRCARAHARLHTHTHTELIYNVMLVSGVL